MASTKQMQARAKARRKSAISKEVDTQNNVDVYTPFGVKTYSNITDYFKEVDNSLARSAQELIKLSSPANVDFSLFCKPAIRTKQLNIGGVKFTTCLYLDKEALAPISRHYGKEFVAMFQIFHKGGSMVLPMTQMTLDDAGHNYCDEEVIAKDDILNRAVAALRLNTNSPAIHHIAMHIAYEETAPESGKPYYQGIDSLAIYRVWD